ncbi:prolipoprotein diacylglyceryl transferase [Micromonospora pisi]|uniref:Phosphatidylglycerol--prolipoprotein diacylglyceryl transferase n=1 Tax=Micromonospora pisi TaxID=589240 RepID=A0A495JDQ7_9ACTN|nr:prolipoprotein diacylglyceryl transferase [Micromonospora pisi]RKR87136.1 prolipoprotein diacylglyceryl transferase [Micromonospora pisi]
MTLASVSPLASLPSPSTAVWEVGPIPIRAYALCIVLGIVVAAVVAEYRLRARGVAPWAILDIAVWAVPFGIVGARIYHVITSPQAYFGADGDPIRALYIWEGGLGIWGAVAGGAVGAWLAARQLGIPLTVAADALAPGLPLAQAVGRFGNWFNNELFGGRTTLPWGLEIHRMDSGNPGHALLDENGNPILEPGLYHPTFAYEALWNVGVALLVFLVDRKLKLGRGRAFALYVMGYTVGRFWIELLRTDQANEILGVRLNVWTAVVVFLGALIYFLRVRGPQQFLVPLGAGTGTVAPGDDEILDGTDGEPAAKSDISQVDLSRRTLAPDTGGVPEGYLVVTEEQYQTYLRTGELPEPAAGATDGADHDLDDESDEPDATATERPDGDDERATGDTGQARAGAAPPGNADRES